MVNGNDLACQSVSALVVRTHQDGAWHKIGGQGMSIGVGAGKAQGRRGQEADDPR